MNLDEALARGILSDRLSISDWARVHYPDPDNQRDFDDRIKKRNLHLKRQILITDLIAACKEGALEFVVINERVPPKKPKLNSSLLNDGPSSTRFNESSSNPTLETNPATDFRIHKADFERFIQKTEKVSQSIDDAVIQPKNQAIKTEETIKIRPRNKQRDTVAIILLHAALDEIEAQYSKTPSDTELVAFVLSGDFKHPNIQQYPNPEDGTLIKNRTLILTDGTKLDKKGITRRYKETIYKL